jgi:hypothetical protein
VARAKLCWWSLIYNSIHKPPALLRFKSMVRDPAVPVEPFQFSPAKPVAYTGVNPVAWDALAAIQCKAACAPQKTI